MTLSLNSSRTESISPCRDDERERVSSKAQEVLKHVRKITVIRLKFTGFLPYLYLYIETICIYIPSQQFLEFLTKFIPQAM